MVEGGKTVSDPMQTAGEITHPQWAMVIELERLSQLFLNPQGQPLPASFLNAEDALTLIGSRGGVSRVSAGTRPGEIFRATTTIRVNGDGDILPAHFGPTFLGPRDEILAHAIAIDLVEPDRDVAVEIDVRAPEGAVAVRLRVFGGWAKGKATSKLAYRFGPSRLYRKIADAPAPAVPATGR